MKTITLIFLCLVGILAIAEYAHSQQQLCDQWGCSADCFERGLHGQCDSDDVCRCYQCIYKACRRYCLRQGQVGQCDEQACMCL